MFDESAHEALFRTEKRAGGKSERVEELDRAYQIGRDVTRQAATVVGALFRAGMTVAASATIQGVLDEGPRSLVEPALYMFTIWALI